MIFNAGTEKDASIVGDIKNNNVSIDTNNIDFIVTILSTNLYSKPIESFIRETVSNAWDSHVEAGVDDPVILELGEDTEGVKFCRIQDFGVGLSPERFEKVYKNIGSSTKRDSNNQIGGFGIGRFSALAYSDVVYITSVYEGVKYSYIMYKDGNSVSINLLNEVETEERNGLEVKLEIKDYDFDDFAKAIKSQLVYFENLYVIDTTGYNDYLSGRPYGASIDIETQYNNFAIKKYNNFWVNTLDNSKEINIVLGKVRYPLRVDNLGGNYPQKVKEYPISLIFNIGDLEVTPNREELLYSDKSKKMIREKLDLAIEEIEYMILNQEVKNVDSISDYLEEIAENKHLYLLEHEEEKVKIKLTKGERKITLNNQSFNTKNFEMMWELLMSYHGFSSQYNLKNGKIKYGQITFNLEKLKSRFERVYFADLGDVNNMSKRYIRETFRYDSYFIKKDAPFKWYAKKYIKHIKDTAEEDRQKTYKVHEDLFYDHRAFKVMMRTILNNLNRIKNFDDESVPDQWIADTKLQDKFSRGLVKKQGFDWKQNINLYEIREGYKKGSLTTEANAYPMKDLKKTFGSLVIYDSKDSSKLRNLYLYFKEKARPPMREVAPTKAKLLDNIDNFVSIDDFMNTKYILVRNIATVEYLRRNFPELKELAKINNLGKISERLNTVVQDLNSFIEKYEADSSSNLSPIHKQELINDIYNLCEGENYFNEEIKGLYLKNLKELQNLKVLPNFSLRIPHSTYTTLPEGGINLLVDYFLARKLVRPNIKSVIKLREETIFNIIKQEENEDNED